MDRLSLQQMELSDFDYTLPRESIAQHPLKQRDQSKLMVVGERIEHKIFYQLVDILQKGDVLVINDSKVIPARLKAKKPTGGNVEVLLVRRCEGNRFNCLLTGRNIRTGTRLIFADQSAAQVISQDCDQYISQYMVEFESEPNLAALGELPTPPYIREPLHDVKEYQTIYARVDGSIAAPTAGFHFTPTLLDRIRAKGVKIATITLHVSFSTFLPVKSARVEDHPMGTERYSIDADNARIINERTGRLFVVGTTTLKALESASDAIGRVNSEEAESNLFIYPGYRFKVKTDGLITNFHLPKSTLLMLVSAFGGRERILDAYQIAQENNYRFYSFGDCMLLFREKAQPQ
jgi:S-adenosylmethionine:tRNA ribosyltransferase-isomerase